jgi:hypothetical protein
MFYLTIQQFQTVPQVVGRTFKQLYSKYLHPLFQLSYRALHDRIDIYRRIYQEEREAVETPVCAANVLPAYLAVIRLSPNFQHSINCFQDDYCSF